MSKFNNNPKHRAAQNKLRTCVVPGCTKLRHGVSPECDKHAQRRGRTGSPTGRALTHAELAPFVAQARTFLTTNAEHPAVKETIARLDHWFDVAASCRATANTNSYDHRCIRELHRLRQDESVTGTEVLVTALGVFMLTQANEHRLPPLSKPHRFELCRAVLSLSTRFYKVHEDSNGKITKHTARTSTVLLDRLGLSLLEETVSLCSHICATIKKKEREDRDSQERLRVALAEPFLAR